MVLTFKGDAARTPQEDPSDYTPPSQCIVPSERVTLGMEGAARLATKYGTYCYLMAIDTEEFVYSFTEATPAPTDAAYFAKVRELHDASVAIGDCSLKCELFKLVRVDTSEAANVRRLRWCLSLTATTSRHWVVSRPHNFLSPELPLFPAAV